MKHLIYILLLCLISLTSWGQVTLQNAVLQNAQLGTNAPGGGGGGGWTKIAEIAQGSGDGNGFTTGTPINTVGTTFIAIVETWFGTRPAVTDSTGANTYRVAVSQDAQDGVPGSDAQICLLYCSNVTTSASHTFTVDGIAVFPSLVVYAYSGGSGGILDQTNGAAINAGSTLQTGPVTPNSANQLIVTGFQTRTDNPVSINSGFATPQILNYAAAQHLGTAGSYLIQGAASTVNPTWTGSGSDFYANVIATFQ